MMHRYLPLLVALVLGSTVSAQDRVASPAPSNDVYRVNPSDVHRIALSQLGDPSSANPELGIAPDTLSYFDTTGSTFYVALTTQAASVYAGTVSFEERFTPGTGNGSVFQGPELPLGADNGQATAIGFAVDGPAAIQNDATLLIYFSKTERADSFAVAPTFDAVFALPISSLAAGFFNEIDVSDANLFFEDDEEFFFGFLLDDDIGAPDDAELQFLLDDGLNCGTTPPPCSPQFGPFVDASFYEPVRSTLFSNPPFVPAPGNYIWQGQSNYWWYAPIEVGALADLDVTVDASCGTVDNCNFQAGQQLQYTVCATNNSGGVASTTVRIFANGPPPITNFQLLNRTVTLPPGGPRCQTFRQNIPGTAPDGFYEIRVDATNPGDMTLQDYDHFFFTKGALSARTLGRPISAVRPQPTDAPAEWQAITETGDFADASASTAAATVAAYPNPFTSQTALRFSVDATTDVRLAVYDLLGREVAVLIDGAVEAGAHEAPFDGRAFAAGIYVYRLTVGTQTETGRMTLVK